MTGQVLLVLGCVVLLFVGFVITMATRNLVDSAKKFAERPAESLLATALELKSRSEALGLSHDLMMTFFKTFLEDVAQNLVALAKHAPDALEKANELAEATEELKNSWKERTREELRGEVESELLKTFEEREFAIAEREDAIHTRDQEVEEQTVVLEQQAQANEQRRRNLEEISRMVDDPSIAARMRMLEPYDEPGSD